MSPYLQPDTNSHGHYGNQLGRSLKAIKIEVPYDPFIPPLHIYLENSVPYHRDISPLLFLAVLSIARKGNQPRCPAQVTGK